MPFCCCCFGKKKKPKQSKPTTRKRPENPKLPEATVISNGLTGFSKSGFVEGNEPQEDHTDLESTSVNLQAELDDATTKIEELQTQIKTTEEKNICLQAEWAEQIKQKDQRINELTELNEKQSESLQLEKTGSVELETIDPKLKDYVKKLESRDQEIAQLSEQVRVKERQVDDLTKKAAKVIMLEENLAMRQEALNGKIAEVAELKEELKDKDRQLQELKESQQPATRNGSTQITKLESIGSSPSNSTVDEPTPRRPMRRLAVVERPDKMEFEPKLLEKNAKIKDFLFNALRKNEFLQYLSESQLREIVNYMRSEEHRRSSVLIREGEEGSCMYVLEDGQCQVTKKGRPIAVMQRGSVFGEIAIVHRTKRTATVKSKTSVKVWYVQRRIYQYVMEKVSKTRTEELRKLLEHTPLSGISMKKLAKIADAIIEEKHNMGTYIVRQGEIGRTFYIIKDGVVQVTENDDVLPDRPETSKGLLTNGNFFGERALQMENHKRTANVIAKSEIVVCLALDKKDFDRLIGREVLASSRLNSLASTPSTMSHRSRVSGQRGSTQINHLNRRPKLSSIILSDLEVEATLGAGAFGRVDLVKSPRLGKVFALKRIKKHVILESGHQENVFREKKIMLECRSDFIVGMFRTFKDDRFVYMLMDACLGGELWEHLKKEKYFSQSRAKFYAGCVIEALDYLQRNKIAHRDLKLENLLLDERGYLQLADFGNAKVLEPGEKTWTFCGTTQYMAPEIITRQGYDLAVDYWSLGVLIFELLNGRTPFEAANEDEIYRLITKGIGGVNFPSNMTHAAKDIVRRLCRDRPTGRLGYLKNGVQDIRNHTWFNGFDWRGLQKGNIQPEFVPKVTDALDTRNFRFDEPTEDDRFVPVDLSGWDENF